MRKFPALSFLSLTLGRGEPTRMEGGIDSHVFQVFQTDNIPKLSENFGK